MTRTTIITADGDRFHQEGRMRRIAIRLGIIIGLIFLSAVIIGFGKAITAPNSPADNSTSTFNDGWDTGLSDIMEIGNSPKGRAHINSCLISSRTVDAFHTCIDR